MSKLAKNDATQAELLDICLNERAQFYDVTGLFWKFFAPNKLNDLDAEYEEGGSFYPYRFEKISPEMFETIENAYEEKPVVISKSSCWVSFHEGYLYIADTPKRLAKQITNEFQDDKHLVM